MHILIKKVKLIGYHFIRLQWVFFLPFSKPKQPRKVIFLVGNQGDGLSFISRVLRRNEKIVSITGSSKYWSGADEIATVMELYLKDELKSPGYFSRENINKTYTKPRSWSYGIDGIINSYKADESSYSKEIENNILKAINTSLIRFGKNKIFLDKSQIFGLKLRLLHKIFGKKAYFIHITRNPYASIYRASIALKAGDLKRYSKFINKEDLFNIALTHYCNTSKTIIKDSKVLPNYKRIKFEDFLTRPEYYTKELCDFLEIDFNYDMLPAKNQKLPFFSKFQERWFPINPNINERYLKEIPENFKRKIQKEAKHIIKTFKYE